MKVLRSNPWFFSALLSLPGLSLLWVAPSWGGLLVFLTFVVVLVLAVYKILPILPLILTLGTLVSALWGSWAPVLTEIPPEVGSTLFQGRVTGDSVFSGRGWTVDVEILWAETPGGQGAGTRWKLRAQSPHLLLPGGFWTSEGWLSEDKKYLVLRYPQETQPPPWWEVVRGSLRDQVRSRFAHLDDQGAALAEGLFLGIREDLSPREGDLFRQAGLSHVLALSGSHLSLWAGFLPWLFPFLPGKWRKLGIPVIVLGFYVWLAGAIPSLQRAYLALVLGALARMGGGDLKGWEVLGMGWLILLVLLPRWFLDPGFQLSFLAMAGLMGPGVLITSCFGKLPWGLSEALGTALGAFLTVLPLALGLFGSVQWSGLVTGLPAGLLVSFILILCGLIHIPLGPGEGVVTSLLGSSLDALMGLCRLGAQCPLWEGNVYWGMIIWSLLGLGAVLVYKVGRERTRKLRLPQGHP